jgi:hypothetical protein
MIVVIAVTARVAACTIRSLLIASLIPSTIEIVVLDWVLHFSGATGATGSVEPSVAGRQTSLKGPAPVLDAVQHAFVACPVDGNFLWPALARIATAPLLIVMGDCLKRHRVNSVFCQGKML